MDNNTMNAILNTKMRAVLPLNGCSIQSRPMGECANSIGQVRDFLSTGYACTAGIQMTPITMIDRSGNALATAATATAADASGVFQLQLPLSSVAMSGLAVWGFKFDFRYGNNYQPAPFQVEVVGMYRDLSQPATTAFRDTANLQTFVVTPQIAANGAVEFITFTTKQAQALNYNSAAATSSVTSLSGQGSYVVAPWPVRLQQPTSYTAVNGTAGNFAVPFLADAQYDAIVVIARNCVNSGIVASFTPFVGCIDSTSIFDAAIGVC